MKNASIRLKLQLPSGSSSSNPSCSIPTSFVKPIKVKPHGKHPRPLLAAATTLIKKQELHKHATSMVEEHAAPISMKLVKDWRRIVIIGGAISMGALVLILNDDQKALALGPGGGPLMEEEFWDNVRRYALYALTVSTGAIYTILLPIFELLKTPITAILIIAILAGSFYILSQVLSAMSGVTDFSYDYNY